ncbi:MAG TPA: hypothetical protein VF389_06175 [Woeseiaceae bacterium]
MPFWIGLRRALLPVAALLIVSTGCTSNPQQAGEAQTEARVKCPAGHTMTCEARTTGRIRHGSFGKNYEKCACVAEGFELPPSPMIPRP